ncbi:MAG: aldehyde dehydrogenase family protein [Thainema sp.]
MHTDLNMLHTNLATSPLRVINPATEELLQEIPTADDLAINQYYQQARSAQPEWAARSLNDRIRILRTFQELLMQEVGFLARLLTSETGKPITQAKNEVRLAAQCIDFFLANVHQLMEPKLLRQAPDPLAFPGLADLEEVLTYDPLGVVANISTWSHPYLAGANVFVPALLTGNAVLYKPSESATLTGLAIADLLYEAGVPKAVFIPVIGADEAGTALVQQPLDGIFFAGSYATGKKVATTAAERLIKVQLQLGGKDPAYVCEDVDLTKVATSLAEGVFCNSGQRCSIERIYVHTLIYDQFVDEFLQTVEAFKFGNPAEPDTYLGPVSRQSHLVALEQQVEDALMKGAFPLCGGYRAEKTGWYFEPTVLVNVDHRMAVMRDETFGPVIGIQEVKDDADAIAKMNDSDYGLTAAVYTQSRERAVQLLRQINSGTVYWNCCDRVSPYLPSTGRKQSGLGATLSHIGLEAFVQPRAWHLCKP